MHWYSLRSREPPTVKNVSCQVLGQRLKIYSPVRSTSQQSLWAHLICVVLGGPVLMSWIAFSSCAPVEPRSTEIFFISLWFVNLDSAEPWKQHSVLDFSLICHRQESPSRKTRIYETLTEVTLMEEIEENSDNSRNDISGNEFWVQK